MPFKFLTTEIKLAMAQIYFIIYFILVDLSFAIESTVTKCIA